MINAIDFLIKEHNHVRKVMADIDKCSHQYQTKRKLFDTLCSELLRHETMEHQVWYPHFKNKLSGEVSHLLSEEKNAEKAIHQFDDIKSEEIFDKKFAEFKNKVEHHAQEEENKLFPEVCRLLSEGELEKIAKQMRQFKREHPIH